MVRAIALLLLLPLAARAAEPAGVVMRVEDKELFIDLGRREGIRDGTRLDLYRRVVLTHPITKKTIEDRFPIGTVEVSEAGELLSIVRAFSNLTRAPAEGDFAVLARKGEAPPPVVVAAPPSAGAVAVPGAEPAVATLHEILQQNLGLPPEAQAAGLRVWLEAYPQHPVGKAVGEAIAILEGQAKDPDPATPRPREGAALAARHIPVSRLEAGRPLELTVGVADARELMSAQLLVRKAGAPTWTTVPMEPAGPRHWRARMPPALVAEAGSVEYAIELLRHDGRSELVGSDLLKPHRLTVEARPAGADPAGPSHARFDFRWVDFNTGGDGTDRYWQTEAAFRYGVRWLALHWVEVGVGLLDGEGGGVEALAAGEPSRSLALGYAYGEAELALGEFVGLGARLTGGNHRATAAGTSTRVFGAQGHLRVGDDAGTHLLLGASGLDDLGARFFAQLEVRSFDRLPLALAAEATNLPVAADYGLRLSGDLGWQATDWLTLKVEAGWNARTINHYGFTSGLGLAMDWE